MRRDVIGTLILAVLLIVSLKIIACSKEPVKEPQLTLRETLLTEKFTPIERVKLFDEDIKPDYDLVDLGEYKLTAYCSCKKCCGKWADNRPNGIVYGASGKELIANYSIGVNPKVIPYGTKVLINGHEYEAMDTGAIKGNHIDIYFSNHDDAVAFGVKYADVCIKNFK